MSNKQYRYDLDRGGLPKLEDRIVFKHTGSPEMNGLLGTIVGHLQPGYTVIVLLDHTLKDGSRATTIPVTCLDKV